MIRKPASGFLTRSNTKQAVQSQKMARSFKFLIKEEEELYYICSENKVTDQLRGNLAADLCFCFRIMQNEGFLMTWLNVINPGKNLV